MVDKVITKDRFIKVWNCGYNFLMGGECIPFEFEFPRIEIMVEEVRADSKVRIYRGRKGPRLEEIDIAERFRSLPIEALLQAEFKIAHYNLGNFYGRGQILHGFEEAVMLPWREFLRGLGFTYRRCEPYLYISGKFCATNYHLDVSNVLVWQIVGEKNFYSLQEPTKWMPIEQAVSSKFRECATKPELTREEVKIEYMKPGDALWNHLLTPHWVEAGSNIAANILISHGGLRLKGELCENERMLERFLEDNSCERLRIRI